MIGRISEAAARSAVAPTLRAVYADPAGDWARQALAQLIAVVEHVVGRSADPTEERRGALRDALADLAGHPLVAPDGPPEQRAADALAAAAGRDDDAARAVQAALRPLLLAELDGELASTMEMMEGFRGRVRDA